MWKKRKINRAGEKGSRVNRWKTRRKEEEKKGSRLATFFKR